MSTRLVPAVALAAALCASAPADDLVEMEPAWEYTTRHRLAVAPVQLDPRAAASRAGEAAAARATAALEEWLRRGGAFDVAPEAVGRRIADGFHLRRAAETPVGQNGLPERFAPEVDAVVVALVTHAGLDITSERGERDRYATDDDKVERDSLNRPVVVGREAVTRIRKVGRAGGVVVVLDAVSGQVLLRSETPPIEIVQDLVAPDTRVDSLEPAEKAGEQLGIDWARAVGPTRVKIDFDNDQLVVAHGWIEDRYDETDQVSPGQGSFVVALRNVPITAARIPFVLALYDDNDQEVWQQGLTWTDDGRPARGTWFTLPVQMLADNGDDEFELRLFAPGKNTPVAKEKFDFEPFE